MKTDLLLPFAIAALLAMMLLGFSPDKVEAHPQQPDATALQEKIQFADSFPDFTIEYVNAFPGKLK